MDFIYQVSSGRYRRPKGMPGAGQFVALREIEEAFDLFIDQFATRKNGIADALFDALRDGKINLREFQIAGARQIAIANVTGALVFLGGQKNMAPSDWGRVGGIVKEDLKYWRETIESLANGAPLDVRVLAKMRNHFKAAAAHVDLHENALMAARGFDEERWFVNDGLHTCEPKGTRPSCTSIAAKKWQPRGSQPRRGLRACYWSCRCRRKFRNSQTGEVRE
jgi:hypothetical protein